MFNSGSKNLAFSNKPRLLATAIPGGEGLAIYTMPLARVESPIIQPGVRRFCGDGLQNDQ